jgi:hypothetical protein
MKLEIDQKGFRFVVVWEEVRGLVKVLLPVITAILTFAAAPEVLKVITLLGW